jgi:hypothetical protein
MTYTIESVREAWAELDKLEQINDSDYNWETHLTNICWTMSDLINDGIGVGLSNGTMKLLAEFTVGDFDATLGIAIAGSRELLVEAMSEVERLRETNEKLRSAAVEFIAAVGLATTAVPTMEINASDPVGMMQRVVAEVQNLRATNERLRAALYKIAGKVPFADDPWTIARKALDRREGR